MNEFDIGNCEIEDVINRIIDNGIEKVMQRNHSGKFIIDNENGFNINENREREMKIIEQKLQRERRTLSSYNKTVIKEANTDTCEYYLLGDKSIIDKTYQILGKKNYTGKPLPKKIRRRDVNPNLLWKEKYDELIKDNDELITQFNIQKDKTNNMNKKIKEFEIKGKSIRELEQMNKELLITKDNLIARFNQSEKIRKEQMKLINMLKREINTMRAALGERSPKMPI